MKRISYAVIILACLIAPALTAFATEPYGIGLWFDSVVYISVAQNIARGNGAIDFNSNPLVDWPPFYPFLIAFAHQLFPVGFTEAARLVSLALHHVTVALTALLIKHHTRSLTMAALGAAATAVFLPVFNASLWAMSEMLFIALTLCLFMAISVYVSKPSLSRLIIAALVTALLCLTRYTGMAVTAITALFLVIFHWRRHNTLISIVVRATMYSVVALLPLMIWAARNVALSGTPFGIRAASSETLSNLALNAIIVFARWFFSPLGSQLLPAAAVMTILLASVIFSMRRNWRAFARQASKLPTSLLYISLFILGYMAFTVMSMLTTNLDILNERYISPISAPILVVFLSLGHTLFVASRARGFALANPLLLLLVFWLALNSLSLLSLVDRVRATGLEFDSRRWRENTLVAALKRSNMLDSCKVYSNNPIAIYLFFERPSHSTPPRTYFRSPQIASELDNKWLVGEEGCVVWFTTESSDFLYTLEELKTTVDFTPIIELESGGVYKVRKRAAP